jgi:hypothetical protein
MNKHQLLLIALEATALTALKRETLTRPKLQALQLQAALLGSQAAIDQLNTPDNEEPPVAGTISLKAIKLITDIALASTIIRTALYDAYRSTAIATYQINEIKHWIWRAEAGACKFCASMNGTIHPITENFESHPNCRCNAEPTQ